MTIFPHHDCLDDNESVRKSRTPSIVKGNKSLRIKSFGLVYMRVTIMRNIETFPSKQMYPYLSLDERKVAEFYHNIDRKR